MTPSIAEEVYRQQRCHKKNIKRKRMIHVLRKEIDGVKSILETDLDPEDRQAFTSMLEENRQVLHALSA